MRLFPLVILITAFLSTTSQAFSVTEEPYASPTVLHSKYRSVVAYLNQQGLKTHFKPALQYSDYIAMAQAGMIDMAFASPGLAQLLRERFDFKLVAVSVQNLSAVLFVSQNSEISQLQQLRGHTILIPEAFDIVSEIARKQLIFPLLEKDDGWLFQEHQKVDHIIYQVMSGQHTAGIVAGYDLDLVAAGLKKNVRILYRSQPVVAHYVLLRNLDHFQNIQTWMLNFHRTVYGEQYEKDFGNSRFIAPQPHHAEEIQAYSAFARFLYEQSLQQPSTVESDD